MVKKIVVTLIFLLTTPILGVIYAQSLCPSNIDPSSRECLNFLRDQAGRLAQSSNRIERDLSNEQYKQLTLQEQIKYTSEKIEQAQKVIQLIEIEVSALNVEIGLLEKEINKIEEGIALSNQEIIILENLINKRIVESYKISFIGPLELFLDVRNID